jgi:hypothetical protein
MIVRLGGIRETDIERKWWKMSAAVVIVRFESLNN